MVQGVLIPLYFLVVASPSQVVKSSLRQLGHTRKHGELATISGTAFHDLIVRLLVCLNRNTPMLVTKLVGYFFYDKKKSN